MLVIAIIVAIRQFIIKETNSISKGLTPCLKQKVYAVVITENNELYYGANWMSSKDISICPRVTNNCKTGEGYELCSTACGQGVKFHAERQAMQNAWLDGVDLHNATLIIVGHTYCCNSCINYMTLMGIKQAGSLDSGKSYNF